VASGLLIDTEKYMAVGLEINANHLRPVKKGYVRGVCQPVHIGGKTHVWDIRLYDDRGKMNCISRLTVAVIPRVG
jgi:1,4-dihydroxy-2-naphthoyl-CoA hydrolase